MKETQARFKADLGGGVTIHWRYYPDFPKVTEFQGIYGFLSNFHVLSTPMEYEGALYPTSEHAYQAAKTISRRDRKPFQHPSGYTPGQAKRAGQKLKVHPDWDQVKRRVMYEILKVKFAPKTMPLVWLMQYMNLELVEGNNHGDDYWGRVNGEGKNWLGKLLMAVRLEAERDWPDNVLF